MVGAEGHRVSNACMHLLVLVKTKENAMSECLGTGISYGRFQYMGFYYVCYNHRVFQELYPEGFEFKIFIFSNHIDVSICQELQIDKCC